MTSQKQTAPARSAEEIEAMAAACRAARAHVKVMRAEYQAKRRTYDELYGAACHYCDLYAVWAKAKYPSGRNENGQRLPKPDPRAMIR